jgi:hypothetical protein
MLDNSSYNKIKLLHELCSMDWFLEKHALKDAQAAGDVDCQEALTSLQKDIRRHIERIRGMVCTITQ